MAITTGIYDPYCPMCGYLKTHCECEVHYYYNNGETWRWSGEHTYATPTSGYGDKINEYGEEPETFHYEFEPCTCCLGIDEDMCWERLENGTCPMMEGANDND